MPCAGEPRESSVNHVHRSELTSGAPERYGQEWPQTLGAVIRIDGNGSPRQGESLWSTLLIGVHVWTLRCRE
jgi:hypothetical protein